MSRHEGVSCDSCLKSNFSGLRYKCLICYDYDLCSVCYNNGAVSSRHTTEHAMQCILTRADMNLYYGGDSSVTNQLQSFTCSYCRQMGFTVVLLQEHIRANHSDVLSVEVVCPICTAQPGGDPNHVTDDLATHITLVHRSGTEFEDDQLSGIRQIRRLTHPIRTSNFGSRPNRGPVMQLIEPPPTGMSQSARDAMDPIAELLSQLTSVRSRAAIAQGMTSHLQQIEMHLASAKHQNEKMALRQSDSAKTSSSSQARSVAAENQSTIAKSTGATSSAGSSTASRSQFLLVRHADRAISENDKQRQEVENADKSLFVQELLLSSMLEDFHVDIDPYSPPMDACSTSSTLETSSTPTLESINTVAVGSGHLVNGERTAKPYPATKKSCNVILSTNERVLNLSDVDNYNSHTTDDSDDDEDDDNDDDDDDERNASAMDDSFPRESQLL